MTGEPSPDLSQPTGRMTIACVTREPGDRMRSVPIPEDIAGRFAIASDGGTER